MPRPLRLLLLADTHLGLDLPVAPRVERRRRGDDFFANFERALAPALRGEVDLVVHGGDLLFRSKVRPSLVQRAVTPLLRVAREGVPVFLVPGNHERSALPYPLLAAHPLLHLFDRPRSFSLACAGLRVTLTGLPYLPRIGETFAAAWAQARPAADAPPADVRLLCLHQAIEGGTVGPADFVFRPGPDVLRGRDLPAGLSAVLSGHLHRQQVLWRDLQGRRLPAPVLYPGSIERTSFAEREEPKGALVVTIEPGPGGAVRWQRLVLPARPMCDVRVAVDGLETEPFRAELCRVLRALAPDAIVRVVAEGSPTPAVEPLLTDVFLRDVAPATMNVTWQRPRAAGAGGDSGDVSAGAAGGGAWRGRATRT